nr:MAG TPA: Portal protein [Bacteriophage sp.]
MALLDSLKFWKPNIPEFKEAGAASTPKQSNGGSSPAFNQDDIKKFTIKATGRSAQSNDLTAAEYSLTEIQNAIKSDSYIKRFVTDYSQLIFKAGYNIIGENDAAAEYIRKRLRLMSFMTNESFDNLMIEIGNDLVAYSNAFLVKSRTDFNGINLSDLTINPVYNNKAVGGYFRIDPSTIEIQRDTNGTIKTYQQTLGNDTVKFKPTDVIHFYIDKEPSNAFGTPRIASALEDVKMLRRIEGNVERLIYRCLFPITQMKVGIPQQGMMATDQEIKEAQQVVEQLVDDGLIITNEKVEFKNLGANNVALNAEPYLNYFEKRVFSALYLSTSMMGRGGVKQDADSMEEQVHDAVKYFQKSISNFIQNNLFNELLLEGGFNPILNEGDIVYFVFNEINLETKVKVENHYLNQYQGNAITFEELRQELGRRADNISLDDVYANAVTQKNKMDLVWAGKGMLTPDGTASPENGDQKAADKSSDENKQISNTDQPENQHGKSSVNIKEFKESADDRNKITKKNIDIYKKNFSVIYNKFQAMRNDVCDDVKNQDAFTIPLTRESIMKMLEKYMEKELAAGYKKAIRDCGNKSPDFTFDIQTVNIVKETKNTIDEIFKEISKRIKKCETREEKESVFNSLEYRLRFLTEYTVSKVYWYAYVKTCNALGKEKVYVDFGNSEDKKSHKNVIDTKHFSLDDIPPFHAYCSCKIKTEKGGE